MRIHIFIIGVTLSGLLAHQANARQIKSLPPIDSPTMITPTQEAPVFRSVPVIKPSADVKTATATKDIAPVAQAAAPVNKAVVPATKPITTEDLKQFDTAFENALSQFPQHRIAKLPLTKQETAPILESPRFQSVPTITKAPAAQSVVDTADQLLLDTNPVAESNSQSPILPASSRTQYLEPNGMSQQLPLDTNVESSFESVQSAWEAPETMAVPNEAGQFADVPALPFEVQAVAGSTVIVQQPMQQQPMLQQAYQPQQQQQFGMPNAAMHPYAHADMLTWWKQVVMNPLDGSRPTEAVDSSGLVYRALQNSPRIQAVSQDPLIRELQIVEADAEFDPVRYLRTQFEDRVDPVGNELTVGNGESFLKDNIWTADAGFRKKNRNGASWELNQRLGFQNSNSNFFVPQDQGTATLALNVTQPLLRGRGTYVNQSQILIAQATNGAAWQSFQAELQDELLGVVSAYWDLYLTRSIYLQKRRNVERGEKILSRLEGRRGLDSLPSQIARARSSVQTRRTELANAMRDIRNAETEVRRRIADTTWIQTGGAELIPGELPTPTTFQVPLEQVVYSALQFRPEVQEAMSRVRVASVQRDVSANDLLPELSLLMGTYVSALRGDTGIGNAFQDQFGQVKPGYSFGLNFELPVRNRAARSRFAQRKLQVRKIKAEVDEVMQTVIAESQVALRRVESASETLRAATEAIRAARSDREQFQKRWESFALVEGDLTDGQNPTTVLDQLLDAQDRLASAELVYVQAERELKVSEVSLQRAMGTLLMTQSVSTSRSFEGDTPRLDVFKAGDVMPATNVIPTTIDGQMPTLAPQMQTAPVNPAGWGEVIQ